MRESEVKKDIVWAVQQAGNKTMVDDHTIGILKNEDYKRIRSQADEWVVKHEHTEFYDPDAYANLGGPFTSVSCYPIKDGEIVAENGQLFGFVFTGTYAVGERMMVRIADIMDETSLLLGKNYIPRPDDDIEAASVTDVFYLERVLHK